MPKLVSPRAWEVYNQLRRRSFSIKQAAQEAGISYATARRYEGKLNAISPAQRPGAREKRQAAGPKRLDELSDVARRALEDFAFFQRRYFGKVATPWQVIAAEKVVELLLTDEKEFLIINAPPGSGKSTTFTRDIPAWLTCRNRAIRGQVGSNVGSSARRYTSTLRREFERTSPRRCEREEDLARGLAFDADACLADDFGAFKIVDRRELWTSGAFVVAQLDDRPIDEKEPTWSAYGFDEGYIGMRYDFVIWDDLVDKKTMRTVDGREKMQSDWDDVAEARLEPGGLLVLQGQRLGPSDLYRYNLNKTFLDDEGEATEQRVYHHLVFKAHYPENCHGRETHRKDAPYWPEGCLLDPKRLSWSELMKKKGQGNFETVYQQEDVNPESVLVDPLWVSGGTDPETGAFYPGCWDNDRDLCELPRGLAGQLLSYVTVDPSPTKWWSIQWWVTRCEDGNAYQRFLMDMERRYNMPAPDLLDWSEPTREFVGVMEGWQARSVQLGLPITQWIIEKNGAQRFLLQYEHVRRWMQKWRVDIVPHETTLNKADPYYGVKTIAGIWKYGLVRLPGKQGGRARFTSLKLVEEATHWPDWMTDDCVMSQWMGEYRLPALIPRPSELPTFRTASWLEGTKTYDWARSWRNA